MRLDHMYFILMRGQVFNIEAAQYLFFGGARSHDIENLLDLDDPDFAEKKKTALER